MNYKGFQIENIPAYVWRMHCFRQDAGHNHIACWYVSDAEGKRVAGGYSAGNNTQSGRADLARRKDAKAWVNGYLAYHNEPENRVITANGIAVHGPSYSTHIPGQDHDERSAFDCGYWCAQKIKRKAAV